MRAEQFLDYIGEGGLHRCQGKQRLNLMRDRYRAYMKAYLVTTYRDAYYLGLCGAGHAATVKGLEDKDAGRPMVQVPELL